MTYRPLPKQVTIKQSEIEGLGLYSTESLYPGQYLGITHVANDRFENGYIRTPLGGFINHSEECNCELIGIGKSKYLITKKDIMPDEEITLTYTLYKVKV